MQHYIANKKEALLAEMVRQLRGNENYVQFANRTGVNRQTLTELERGELVRVETLRRIKNACNLNDQRWTEMLGAWIRAAVGEEEFSRLELRPASNPDLDKAEDLFLSLYRRLNNYEKAHILKAMMRKEVRHCLFAINNLWDRGSDLDEPIQHEAPHRYEQIVNEIERLKKAGPFISNDATKASKKRSRTQKPKS